MRIYKIDEFPAPVRPAAIIEGLIYPGQISLLYAPSGVGKSALIVDMLVRASLGRVFAGRQTEPVDVVWLATENIQEHHIRLDAVIRQMSMKDNNNGHHWLAGDAFTLTGSSSVVQIETLADHLNAEKRDRHQVVVIDTLNQALAGIDENGSAGMSEAISRIKYLMFLVPDLHVMIVHHSGKKKENGPRGHSSLLCAVDTAMFISSLKNNLQMEVTKQRCGKTSGKIKFNLDSIESELEDGTTQSSVSIEHL